ncbi:MAG: hypothetical protein AB7G75_08835 [Candidatus Binatia bacterium]
MKQEYRQHWVSGAMAVTLEAARESRLSYAEAEQLVQSLTWLYEVVSTRRSELEPQPKSSAPAVLSLSLNRGQTMHHHASSMDHKKPSGSRDITIAGRLIDSAGLERGKSDNGTLGSIILLLMSVSQLLPPNCGFSRSIGTAHRLRSG